MAARFPCAVCTPMTDTLTREARSALMSRIRGKDTVPEIYLRQLVHAMGYRYRLHRRDLPGTPDLVFAGRKKVIFMHGCFWHLHDDPKCKLARMPNSNQDYWKPKLERNRERDQENRAKLEALGWQVLVIWECQTRQKNPEPLRQQVSLFLEDSATRETLIKSKDGLVQTTTR